MAEQQNRRSLARAQAGYGEGHRIGKHHHGKAINHNLQTSLAPSMQDDIILNQDDYERTQGQQQTGRAHPSVELGEFGQYSIYFGIEGESFAERKRSAQGRGSQSTEDADQAARGKGKGKKRTNQHGGSSHGKQG